MKSGMTLTWLVIGVFAAAFAPAAFTDDPAQPSKLYIYSGTLQSMDLKARTIIVESSAVSQKFIVPTDAEIIVKDKPKGELSDLMVGDGIQVKYTDDDGVHVAHQISLLGLKIP